MRIATWNVEWPTPAGHTVPPAQVRRMAEVDADVWVLTEMRPDHTPTPEHTHVVCSPAHPERRPAQERWTAIWSRWPVTPVTERRDEAFAGLVADVRVVAEVVAG